MTAPHVSPEPTEEVALCESCYEGECDGHASHPLECECPAEFFDDQEVQP